MICREVFSPKLMHTNLSGLRKVRPTAHCNCSRSDASNNHMIYIRNHMCLFFDQVNIYAIFRGLIGRHRAPSTDLSTDFVDKTAGWLLVVVGQRLTWPYVPTGCLPGQSRI